MQTGLGLAAAIIGKASLAAVASGGILVLFGLIGFARVLVLSREPAPERGRSRHSLLIITSALLLVIGGLVLLGGGILYPLKVLRVDLAFVASKQTRQEELLGRIINLESARMVRAILSRPKYEDRKKLNRYEYKVLSQNGEDGILAEIFRRIGTTNRYFVEFGAASGSENNTVLLLRQGWSGFWMDGDPVEVNAAKTRFRPEIEGNRLTVKETFITAENIEELFREGKVPEEFDLLSIDIDRNDYYVWEKISHFRPRVVVIEYNSKFPPTMSWVVPYDPKAWGWSEYGNGELKRSRSSAPRRDTASWVARSAASMRFSFEAISSATTLQARTRPRATTSLIATITSWSIRTKTTHGVGSRKWNRPETRFHWPFHYVNRHMPRWRFGLVTLFRRGEVVFGEECRYFPPKHTLEGSPPKRGRRNIPVWLSWDCATS